MSFENLAGYQRTNLPQTAVVAYYDERIEIEFSRPDKNSLNVGSVLLSKAGQELASICESAPRPGFRDYAIERWQGAGLKVRILS